MRTSRITGSRRHRHGYRPRCGSELVAQFPQQTVPRGGVGVRLHADRGQAINDSGDTAASTGGGDQNFYRVGRGTSGTALTWFMTLTGNPPRSTITKA